MTGRRYWHKAWQARCDPGRNEESGRPALHPAPSRRPWATTKKRALRDRSTRPPPPPGQKASSRCVHRSPARPPRSMSPRRRVPQVRPRRAPGRGRVSTRGSGPLPGARAPGLPPHRRSHYRRHRWFHPRRHRGRVSKQPRGGRPAEARSGTHCHRPSTRSPPGPRVHGWKS